MRLPICVKCNKQYIPEKNNVSVLFLNDDEPDCIYYADLYKCPKCKNQILAGFGANAIAYAFHTDAFKELVKEVDIKINFKGE